MNKRGYFFCVFCAALAIVSIFARPAVSAVDANGTLLKPFNVLVKNDGKQSVPVTVTGGSVQATANVTVSPAINPAFKDIRFVLVPASAAGNGNSFGTNVLEDPGVARFLANNLFQIISIQPNANGSLLVVFGRVNNNQI